jgi:hypothetical protein
MTHEELVIAVRKVSEAVGRLVDPVAASLVELERAHRFRRNGIVLIVILVLGIQASQFYLIFSNRALIRHVHETMTACLPEGEPGRAP